MIGRLRGLLIEKRPPRLLVECHGVGYEVDAPMTTIWALPDLNAEVILHTHLVVREDAQSLYGFATLAERELFQSLLKVSGVGAKMALAEHPTFAMQSRVMGYAAPVNARFLTPPRSFTMYGQQVGSYTALVLSMAQLGATLNDAFVRMSVTHWTASSTSHPMHV